MPNDRGIKPGMVIKILINLYFAGVHKPLPHCGG